ncbi:DUF4348 domain-containing protein [Pontibacter burrus]|uniref:DUF4348 domain-containing protein n=1 Tax=Pontibacter burrus TaxID=2704466 RepID=A0A6B3LYX3_9BACT|nr:DUF4348 domain-containing protein [Pontibacter burrus]NEM98830.1 DUF4348 domain-containing protein [Pontibacter burrus]
MRYVISLSFLLLYSCSSSNDPNEVQAPNVVAEANIDMFAHIDSSFWDFAVNFGFNKDLQKQRIKFPLEYEEFGVSSLIDSSRWKHERLFVDLEAITEISNGLRENKRTTEKVFTWIDTKTSVSKNYYFKKRRGKWYLDKISSVQENALDNEEDFNSFLREFCKDSVFQKQRIKFPLDMTTLDNDYNDKREFIKSDQWRYTSFYYGCDSISTTFDDFNRSFKNTNIRVLIIHGIENGINAQFTFEKDSGKWVMTKFEDHST